MWYYTKEWPNIFEVYDKKQKMCIKIVGRANVYEKIKSDYIITLDSKEQALKQYKLIKALFILSTAFPDDFNFKTKINDEGSLEFSLKTTLWEKEINYENLTDFIQFEANQKRMLINLEEKKIQEAQAKLEKIKNGEFEPVLNWEAGAVENGVETRNYYYEGKKIESEEYDKKVDEYTKKYNFKEVSKKITNENVDKYVK